MDKIYRIATLPEAMETVDKQQELFLDTETIGKYGKIRLVQLYQRDWTQALLIENPDPIQLFLWLASLTDTNIVMQYSSYDISTIQIQSGTRYIPHLFDDTFLLARLAFPRLDSFSLDTLIAHVNDGVDPYEEAGIDKKAMQKQNWKAVRLSSEQLLYAALDVYYMPVLYDHVKEHCAALSYNLDKHALRHALDFQNNGLPVVYSRVDAIYASNIAKLEELNIPINVNSYKQVRPYINSDSSDDLGLARLSMEGNERAAMVRAARKLHKNNSFLNKYNTDTGYIYGKFMPSARSGRFTCSDDNLQQLPRVHKQCFGFEPNGDRVLIYADFSQLELRTIAAITGEPTMVKLYREGIDIHNYVAEILFGKDFTEAQRQIAKTCNFNLLYYGGAPMFQNILIKTADIWLPVEECAKIKRQWLKLFPGLNAWQERGVRDFHRNTLGCTPFGRKYMGRMMTDQLNIENQGFGAEVAKLSLHYMKPKLDVAGGIIHNFVHDDYTASCENKEATFKECAAIIGDSMQEAWREASKMAKVKDLPMPVTVRVGWNLGDIEAGDFFYEYKI